MRIKTKKKKYTKSKVLVVSKNCNKVLQFIYSNIRTFYEKSLNENKTCTERIVLFRTKKNIPQILSYEIIKKGKCEYFELFLHKYFIAVSEINNFLMLFLSNFKLLQELINIGLKFNNFSREEYKDYIEEKSYQINTFLKTKNMIKEKIMQNELEMALFSDIH